MKKILALSAISIGLLFGSCQKVIEIDLNSKEPLIVIEGNISDQPGPYMITITNSVNFSDDNSFPAVSGAMVAVSDDLGNSETLTETSPGIYQTNSFQGLAGHTYYLNVTANGKSYTAESTMPNLVSLDSLVLESGANIGGAVNYVIPLWLDPLGMGNYYRCIEYINGVRVSGSFLYDDAFSDGLVNGQPLLDFSTEILSGDTVDVELQCIDKATYLYFYSMSQTANNQTAAPANPVTNISNGALGYFNAYSVTRRTVIVP
jgi:Domain of unknown function (DUF4249)